MVGLLASTVIQCNFRHYASLCASRSERFGEASHPGPGFTLGTFNPTGLGAKHGVVAQMEPGIYAVTETHLTNKGLQDFKTGLKLGEAQFSFLHGHAVQPRARSPATGAYQGVGFLSSFPARVVAQAWPPEVYQTSRVQVASFLVGDIWVLVAYAMVLLRRRDVQGPSWMQSWIGCSPNLWAHVSWRGIGIWNSTSCHSWPCSRLEVSLRSRI